jgi:hypothetical protein
MASNKRQIINLVESSDVEISIKRSVQRSSSSKIIVIDHDDIVSGSINAAPAAYVEFSNIIKSVQRSSSSKKIVVIDHDMVIDVDKDESLQRSEEGKINFAEDGEDNVSYSSSVQLVSRSIIAAPAYVDEVKESESSEDDDKTLELKLEEDDDKTLELKLE